MTGTVRLGWAILMILVVALLAVLLAGCSAILSDRLLGSQFFSAANFLAIAVPMKSPAPITAAVACRGAIRLSAVRVVQVSVYF